VILVSCGAMTLPMRLLLISAGTIILTLMLLLMIRFWGLSQPYQAFNHEFLKAPTPWQVVKIHSAPEAQALLNHNKEVIFWLDLAKTSDGHFLIINPERKITLTPDLLKENYRSDKTYFYDLKFLRLYYDKEPLLADFLAEFPGNRFILNIQDNAPDIQTAVINVLLRKKLKTEC
jgi:hypothetical protein